MERYRANKKKGRTTLYSNEESKQDDWRGVLPIDIVGRVRHCKTVTIDYSSAIDQYARRRYRYPKSEHRSPVTYAPHIKANEQSEGFNIPS